MFVVRSAGMLCVCSQVSKQESHVFVVRSASKMTFVVRSAGKIMFVVRSAGKTCMYVLRSSGSIHVSACVVRSGSGVHILV